MTAGAQSPVPKQEPFRCQMPVAVPPRPRCQEQCESCRLWQARGKE